MKPERLIGVGAAGLFLGLTIGAIVFRDANTAKREDPTPVETATAPVKAADPVAPAKSPQDNATAGPANEKTPSAPPTKPGEAEEEEETLELPPAKGMSEDLSLAVADDEWFLDVRNTIHKTLGTGALFRNGAPTEVGQWIVNRVSALDDHAVPVGPYEALGVQSALRAAEDTKNERVIARAEAVLGRALVRLVLDWRFIKKTGPHKNGLLSEKTLRNPKNKKYRQRIIKVALAVAGAGSEAEAMAHLDPPHPNYQPMLKALSKYRQMANSDLCVRIDPSLKIRPGAKGGYVTRLQKRMKCEGLYDGPISGTYDEELKAAVQIYQRTHELDDDGLVFKSSIQSMNVPLNRRVEQIELTLQRLRESRVREMDDFYIAVNIPSFELEAVHNGEIVRRHKVIVGTNRLDDDKLKLRQGHLNRTQLFTTNLYEVIVNPAWILPERISKGELEGKIAEDPDYMAKNNIKEKTLPNGRKVLIQGFGKTNVLGKVKFLLEKSNAIFLHDTDKRDMFRHTKRDFSHGCMRVHRAIEFAKWLLHRDGYTEKEIGRAFKLTKRQRGMPLKTKVTLMTEYMTVDLDADGRPMFLTDVYGYDKAVSQNKLPVKAYTRWGAPRLRPHWVPLVPQETVNAWRRAGKPAPRNYDPSKHGG